jgi:hypothetical protein
MLALNSMSIGHGMKNIGATSESEENFEKTSFFRSFAKLQKSPGFSPKKTVELCFMLKQHVPYMYYTAKCSVCVCSGGGGLHTDSLFFIGYINEITALNY